MLFAKRHQAMDRVIEFPTLERVAQWFGARGGTDFAYLESSFSRMSETYNFAQASLARPSDILDIGAHFLHQAFLFANDGHRVISCDVPATMSNQTVKNIAQELGIELLSYKRLDLGEGIRDLPPDSVDLVIIGEVIEHLAFNPISMWKAIYSALRPGGRIVLTTPNSNYFRSVIGRVEYIIKNGGWGLAISEVLTTGTYGHHWKEYNLTELQYLFDTLSADFKVTRHKYWGGDSRDAQDLISFISHYRDQSDEMPKLIAARLLESLAHAGHSSLGALILLEVEIIEKQEGIKVKPPWESD